MAMRIIYLNEVDEYRTGMAVIPVNSPVGILENAVCEIRIGDEVFQQTGRGESVFMEMESGELVSIQFDHNNTFGIEEAWKMEESPVRAKSVLAVLVVSVGFSLLTAYLIHLGVWWSYTLAIWTTILTLFMFVSFILGLLDISSQPKPVCRNVNDPAYRPSGED